MSNRPRTGVVRRTLKKSPETKPPPIETGPWLPAAVIRSSPSAPSASSAESAGSSRMIAKSLTDSGAVTIRRPPPPDSLPGAVVAQEDSNERPTSGNAGHVSVEERRDDREGPHGRDQADDQAGNYSEGMAGPAQQLPCDVLQIQDDCTWQPRGGRKSASSDAFLGGREPFHHPLRAWTRKVNGSS